jgi:hypothetical protein
MEIKAGEMVTEQGCGLVVVDVTRGVLRPTGHHWVTLFPCPSQLRTGRCIWMVVRSHILLSRVYTSGWGLERLVILLSWVPAPSGPTEGGLYMDIRRFSTARGRGLGVLVWTGTRLSWQEDNVLVPFVPRYGRGVCFSGYPAGLHWFANRRVSGPIWLDPGIIVRTEREKMNNDGFVLTNSCLKIS